ncbi:MAG: hypothetical protein CME62_02290 [Halobacteriovoraceae bacterium]|nr:hypothetical protein [Halobacteriovoraceae bacterium]|tara:strand:+ start:2060 stop:2500 length:441 start_codon:yes stop_codon:yes gene_type:complete
MDDNNTETETGTGIFINGRQQIIEMLQFMDESERRKLLKNIEMRNSVMARELSEQSLSFNDLARLSEESLNNIFSRTNPAIIGLALYNCKAELQRKVLTSLDREIAERAFEIMNKNLSAKKLECKRAQEKVLDIVIQLNRKQLISL